MDIILCHTTADFDALGAAVGLTRLRHGAKLVLTGGCHPGVRDFLALHRDEYALIERRSVNPQHIRCLFIVDTQKRHRLGKAAEWLDLPNISEICLYDHHPDTLTDIPATYTQIEAVGATTTLIVELLQKQNISLTPVEATVMALGIHVDTGSLVFHSSTPRDAIALAWLMQQGANLSVIGDHIDPSLPPQLQELFTIALDKLSSETLHGQQISWVLLSTLDYVPGLSTLATRLIEITESDALLLASIYSVSPNPQIRAIQSEQRLTVIGRSRIQGTNLNQLFQPLGGGGHPQAASMTLRGVNALETLNQLVMQFKQQIPHPPTAKELMSSPVRTIRPETTIEEAQRILLRYGHSGLSVVNEQEQLTGIISRRDIDLALHHGFSHAPAKGYMTTNLKTITPQTLLPEIEALMVTYDIGRLPVLENEQLVGIVTRTDVLRELHQEKSRGINAENLETEVNYCSLSRSIENLFRHHLAPKLQELLSQVSTLAQQRGWHLYLVGGAVRDLLLADVSQEIIITDIDLVVDGFHNSADVGAGVILARELQLLYPNSRLEVHGQFQTAALLWHKDPVFDSLWLDIATARTEFYPYPAANPEVEASSIRQDLYRRDFTINALALRLTSPYQGELLDFFSGLSDLQAKQIRVLHANSFIEDPTRIYRAVRFATRLGFTIESQTERYIRYAIASGIYNQRGVVKQQESKGDYVVVKKRVPALETRLKSELKYILESQYWKSALRLLGDLGALQCIHQTLHLDAELWWRIRLVYRCLSQFDQNKILSNWLMRLEVLIAYLQPKYRGYVAKNLQLSEASIQRLEKLESAQNTIVNSLRECRLSSQIFKLLKQYDLSTLILIAVQSSKIIRKQIWNYLIYLSNIKAPLTGNDLKMLGYKPGREFKEILDTLLAATLDGEFNVTDEKVSSRSQAEFFLKQHFPLDNNGEWIMGNRE